ncbi:hypothetical protein BH11BAC2_BH11BAC2_25380 [soil metagenome]
MVHFVTFQNTGVAKINIRKIEIYRYSTLATEE